MSLNRQEQIVEELNIQPDDRVLEIGCGHGVAASAVCSKLTNGRYVGVDRSTKMIKAATDRNQKYVDSGIATFLMQDLESLDLGGQKFDKIFAVRVRLFYEEPERAKGILEKYLAKDGTITSIYDTPSSEVRLVSPSTYDE